MFVPNTELVSVGRKEVKERKNCAHVRSVQKINYSPSIRLTIFRPSRLVLCNNELLWSLLSSFYDVDPFPISLLYCQQQKWSNILRREWEKRRQKCYKSSFLLHRKSVILMKGEKLFKKPKFYKQVPCRRRIKKKCRWRYRHTYTDSVITPNDIKFNSHRVIRDFPSQIFIILQKQWWYLSDDFSLILLVYFADAYRNGSGTCG